MKILVPLALVLLGLALLVGCIYVPTAEIVKSGKPVKNATSLFGAETSNRPIRLGSITRDQVLARLGPPTCAMHDHLVYEWETKQGLWLTICWGIADDAVRDYALELTFDGSDRLIAYKLGLGHAGQLSYVIQEGHAKVISTQP